MDQIKEEAVDQELPPFKEVVASPEKGSDEERYAKAKEEVGAAIAELRTQKEMLKTLGVDADGLTDAELMDSVHEAQKNASASIREYLLAHPESELPEAVEERAELIAAVEQKIEFLQRQMKENVAWAEKYVGQGVGTWTNPEDLPNKMRERMTFDRSMLDEVRAQLAQAALYKDIFDSKGVMENPEVKRTYQPAVDANNKVRTLESELRMIKGKATSRFFGYTEKKKEEEVQRKEGELNLAKEEANVAGDVYNAAAKAFQDRHRKFEEIFRRQGGGGYENARRELEASIGEKEKRLSEQQEKLSHAMYYAESQHKLISELDAQMHELTLLKGGKSDET